jgi:peptidoglycan L-alanyl-D-glutamate endopeptidase CwlK
MAKFGKESLEKLRTCDPRLQALFAQVVLIQDCKVLEGHRSEEAQNKAFRDGKSKLKYPMGRHNKTPSIAADVVVFPVDFSETPLAVRRHYWFAGIVQGVAAQMKIPVRWGGNWDGADLENQSFNDLVHWELV